jgi:hypothetical protein
LGLGSPLAAPPRAGCRRTRSPSTRPPHIPDPPHEGCTEGGGISEEEGAPGPPMTDEKRSYSTLFVLIILCRFSCLLFHIYSIEKNQK